MLLGDLVAEIGETSRVMGWEVDVIAIDDGSIDKTWEVILELGRTTDVPVQGVRLDRNFGKAVAQAVGIRAAIDRPGIVVLMDADGQHDPSDLIDLVLAAAENNAATIGRRVDYRRSLPSAIGTRALVMVTRLLGVPYDPASSEFIALPGPDARRLANDPQLGLLPIVPLVERTAVTCRHVDIEIKPRRGDPTHSNWGFSALGKKGLLHIFVDPWGLLMRLALIMGCLAILLLGYGLVIGIISIASESFLGIASTLVALVFVFVALSATALLTLGILLLLVSAHELPPSQNVAEGSFSSSRDKASSP